MVQHVLWVLMSIVRVLTNASEGNFLLGGVAIGGIFAIIALILGYALVVQILTFAVVSTGSVVAKYLWPKPEKSIQKDSQDLTGVYMQKNSIACPYIRQEG